MQEDSSLGNWLGGSVSHQNRKERYGGELEKKDDGFCVDYDKLKVCMEDSKGDLQSSEKSGHEILTSKSSACRQFEPLKKMVLKAFAYFTTMKLTSSEGMLFLKGG